MALSVDRLRVWLVVGVALLVLVIAGFLGYARYRTHRFLAGLPGRLGVDIRRETNGYTYSQSIGGKTVMTLHAAKAIEHRNGKLTLHDVGMILYGRKQDRADRISGSEFEYDQASGVVRAMGEVLIDLEAPAAAPRTKDSKTISAVPQEAGGESQRIIHVKTSGLVYLQKLGIAATDKDLEFRFGGLTGHATGAEYNADTGVLTLQAAVKANGIAQGRPVVLTASHAELERESQVALLTQARYVSPAQTVRGNHAVVHLRSDGSPERIEADGGVALEAPAAGTMMVQRADVSFHPGGQAQRAHFFGAGGVQYTESGSLREGTGQAADAQVAFDAAGRAENVVLMGAVHTRERVRSDDQAPWNVRDATAGKMTFALAGEGAAGGRRELRAVEASSSARMVLVSDAGAPGSATSEISGDTLRGRFNGSGKTARLSEIHGIGHTALRKVSGDGAEQTSAGDTLDVDLRAASGANDKPSKKAAGHQTGTRKAGAEEIVKAVQAGHVVLTSRAALKAGEHAPRTVRATADLGVYNGDADQLTMSGHAQVTDEGSTVAANRIVMEHGSGDAAAEGAVKVNYLQGSSAEPVHVLADRAEMKHDAGKAFFYGAAGAGRPARMWQGASQVEAPVIELDQEKRSMSAHGEAGDAVADGAIQAVHAVLVGKGAGKTEGTARLSVVRIASRTMVYLDSARQVDFAGEVKVEDADGTLRARQATAYLQPVGGADAGVKNAPVKTAASPASGMFFGGGVERIVASGRVEIDQPGRQAVGEQLVYTAGDGMFVLTGTPAALPKLVDEVQGTVTGTALSFHTGDDRVMVTGEAAAGQRNAGQPNAGQRVHTVTRVKQK